MDPLGAILLLPVEKEEKNSRNCDEVNDTDR